MGRGGRISRLLGGAAAAALLIGAGAARAEDLALNIAPQPLGDALNEFAVQAKQGVVFAPGLVAEKTTRGVQTAPTAEIALAQLLAGTGLTYRSSGGTFLIVRADGPQSGSAARDGAEVEALIVTAQKREEDIQDVPIAISAFTQEDLERSQIAGGPDLMTQVPNMTFTKTNFASYSIQIRGIGTQAISATTDPAVAVAYLNTPFIRNRFFEQEFYDLQRVEVLRGPQGTLYGRNATAGVVNLLPARPRHVLEAKISADVANYGATRLEGMINLPLVEDVVALRLAGAWTKRDGYALNQMTGNRIDGRDLWSVRATIGFEPTDGISAYLTYEHFEEDDDRIRSGKQLCKKAPTPDEVGGVVVRKTGSTTLGGTFGHLSYLSQGCEAGSLYSAESFQTPNAHGLPYYGALRDIGVPIDSTKDAYLRATQSQDLRVIESTIEPHYQADTDILHLQVNFDLTDSLTLTSETAYSYDTVFSTQDYNRFTTTPGVFETSGFQFEGLPIGVIDPETGQFCDPQLGCSDRVLLGDLSTADSQQYSQEFRLSSDFDTPLNFSVGANFLRHDAIDKYYVFVNTLSLWAAKRFGTANASSDTYIPGVSDNLDCLRAPFGGSPDQVYQVACVYMDPNPIGALNDQGHNYFLSKNPYRLISYAAFGEVYYNVTPDLKITAGLRFTVDKKHAPEIPSWLLAGGSYGYPVAGIIDQEWREPTGRLAIDWHPDLAFTDETLLYASYAHGYKAGGANPPRPVLVTYSNVGISAEVQEAQTTFPKTFEPEFIDAYEIGAKNTLFDGRVTANLSAFYYDYEGYQISEIANRSALNRNFDTEVWGAELELDWRPTDNFRIGFKQGWEKTRVADGERVIDLMDRSAGDPDYMVIKAFPTVPSNCIVPVEWVADLLAANGTTGFGNPLSQACLNYLGYNNLPAALQNVPNNGEGIFKDLSGNELPNAPEFTTTVTADYTLPLRGDWMLTLHADYYRQSEAWWRIINSDPYDRLQPYQTVNFAAFFTNEDAGWKVMAYIKNVFDEDSITGAFLNSDDSGLTTNVFLTEPRLYGLRVTKDWTDMSWGWAASGADEGPYPITLEIGGGALRTDAPNEVLQPAFVGDYMGPELPFPMSPQEEDLDWGDGREVRLAYRAPGSPWSLAASARFGRANGTAGIEYSDQVPGGYIFGSNPAYYRTGPYEFTRTTVKDREEHSIVDFKVGRDAGLGGLLEESSFHVGLRYAQLKSSTQVNLAASSYYFVRYGAALSSDNIADRVEAELESRRSFEGVGPAVEWSASKALAGDGQRGTLNLDWSIEGSMLFGRQKSDVVGGYTDVHHSGSWLNIFAAFALPVVPTSSAEGEFGSSPRSNDVSVPSVGGSLGLSYSVGRVRLGAGYRWERYYGVFDAGIDEADQYDRTIDGPYLKLRIGFGG